MNTLRRWLKRLVIEAYCRGWLPHTLVTLVFRFGGLRDV